MRSEVRRLRRIAGRLRALGIRQRRRGGPFAQRRVRRAFEAMSPRPGPDRHQSTLPVAIVTVAPDGVDAAWLRAIAVSDPSAVTITVVTDQPVPAVRLGGMTLTVVPSAGATGTAPDPRIAGIRATSEPLVLLLSPNARLIGRTWLGRLAAQLADDVVAIAPTLIHARGRGIVRAWQTWSDLTVASAGIDVVRYSGAPLPEHRGMGSPNLPHPTVQDVEGLSSHVLLGRRADLLAALEAAPINGPDELIPGRPPMADGGLGLWLAADGRRLVIDRSVGAWLRTSKTDRAGTAVRTAPDDGKADREAFYGAFGPWLYRRTLGAALGADPGAGPEDGRGLAILAVADAAALTGLRDADRAEALPSGWSIRWRSPDALSSWDLETADVLIVATDAVDLRGQPGGTIRVAWPGRDDRPVPASLDEADIVLAQDAAHAAALRIRTVKRVTVADRSAASAASDLAVAIRTWLGARRVAIRIEAGNWPNVERWGDFHFARSLQRAFEGAGHPTRVRLRPEWSTSATANDDVTVHLFGKTAARNRPSQLNVLWQISHPDLADAALYQSYDLAFAASDPFAVRMAANAGVPVGVLPQATDPDRFRPEPGGTPHELLYVANHRADRPVAAWLIPTDRDLAIYGQGWEALPAAAPYWRGEPIPNDALGRVYASASIVLNDTWADMRDHGFISNRVFDVLAAGGFVISDAVAGLDALFEGAVPTYTDETTLHATIERYLGDPEGRDALASRGRAIVLARHTFDHRVATILGAVADLRPRGRIPGEVGVRYAPPSSMSGRPPASSPTPQDPASR